MPITKNIINDLLPLYAANECSADTRALVEDYLQKNPREAEELRRIMNLTTPLAPPSAASLAETRSFREARRRVRQRAGLMAFAIFFSLAPFSVFTDGHQTRWLFLESPRSALIYGAIGVACWIAYAVARKRARSI